MQSSNLVVHELTCKMTSWWSERAGPFAPRDYWGKIWYNARCTGRSQVTDKPELQHSVSVNSDCKIHVFISQEERCPIDTAWCPCVRYVRSCWSSRFRWATGGTPERRYCNNQFCLPQTCALMRWSTSRGAWGCSCRGNSPRPRRRSRRGSTWTPASPSRTGKDPATDCQANWIEAQNCLFTNGLNNRWQE